MPAPGNIWAGVTKAAQAWFQGRDVSGIPKTPTVINNEGISAVNAAGTALVDLVLLDTNNIVQLPNGASIPTGKTLAVTDAGAITMTRPKIITSIDDSAGLAQISISPTTSAVNNLQVKNAVATIGPDLSAVGTDANISPTLTPKGSGVFTFGSSGTAVAIAGAATLNTQIGVVTSEALITAAGATYTLTLTNSKITTASRVLVMCGNGTNTGGQQAVARVQPAAGSVAIDVRNIHATTAFNGTITITFLVL